MARRRKYYVTASRDGIAVGPQIERSLGRAAKTANKMADQGLEDIRVADRLGTAIGKEALAKAWQRNANPSLVKRGIRVAGQID